MRPAFLRQAFLSTVGWTSVVLAIAGALLPLLPCTPFALLAAACFARSSPWAMRWLRRSPLLGRPLRDWERHRGLRLRSKLTAVGLVLTAPLITFILIPGFSIPLCLSIFGSSLALIVIARLPTVRLKHITIHPGSPRPDAEEKQLPLAA